MDSTLTPNMLFKNSGIKVFKSVRYDASDFGTIVGDFWHYFEKKKRKKILKLKIKKMYLHLQLGN